MDDFIIFALCRYVEACENEEPSDYLEQCGLDVDARIDINMNYDLL